MGGGYYSRGQWAFAAVVLLGFAATFVYVLANVYSLWGVNDRDDDGVQFTPMTTTAPPPAPTLREVLYEVEGTASTASITMETPDGTSQASARVVPLRQRASVARGLRMQFAPGSFVYISAQNEGESGSITCRITVDGEVISENRSEGAYAIASCDGTA